VSKSHLYRCAEIAKTPQQRRVFESHCERRKRYVFSFVLNVDSDMFSCKAGGRLFHTAGPLYAKLRSPVEVKGGMGKCMKLKMNKTTKRRKTKKW